MTMYPDDSTTGKNPMPVNRDLGTAGNFSKAAKSNITSPDEDRTKEERIANIIDSIVSEKIKPINAQLEQMPQLIKDTIVMVLNEIAVEQQKQTPTQAASAAPQNQNNIGEFLKAVGPLLGGASEPAPDPMLEMIKGAFSKMIQAKVDETIMGTYGVRINPPATLTEPVKTNRNSNDLVE